MSAAAYYYKLKEQGNAPQELRMGNRVIITRGAAEKWEERMLSQQTIVQGFVVL